MAKLKVNWHPPMKADSSGRKDTIPLGVYKPKMVLDAEIKSDSGSKKEEEIPVFGSSNQKYRFEIKVKQK